MKRFSYLDATTLDDAVSALSAGDAVVIAGGTDILNLLKARSLPKPPKAVVNIKSIPGLSDIREDDAGLKIGALSKLCDIEENNIIREKYPLLFQAVHAVASPQIRNMGTLGGNICQETRCWYYRYPENVFYCLRKGGKNCPALTGENRFHSVFGAIKVSDPPCQSKCPGSVNIPSYLSKVREGALEEAVRILLDTNPIPAVTGRVCPHVCQEECNRTDFDDSVSIRNVERFVGDYILENASKLISPPENETGCRVAIIGSGPAGLSAAYYLRKSGHQVTVFDKMEKAGGMLAYAIPAYRLPRELVGSVVKAIESMGVQFKLKVDVGKDVPLGSIRKDFGNVFLSTGAWAQPSIGLQGEELTKSGLSFLTERLPAEDQVKGKRILVVGGGNVAVDVGITAKRLGAEEVILACLESREEMPAFKWEIEQALEEGVKLMPSWGPFKVVAKSGHVKSVELVRCASVFDAEGNFCPSLDNSIRELIEADEVLMAVGQKADLSYLDSDLRLGIRRGLIAVEAEAQETSIPGLFAGGDVTTGPASVIEAVAAGRRAAIAIDRALGRGVPYHGNVMDKVHGPFLSFNTDYLKKTRPVILRQRPIFERTVDGEDTSGLVWDQAKEESNRCFNCGCVAASPSDMAPALIALDAKIRTTKRTIAAEDFFSAGVMKSTVLEKDEFVTGVEIPRAKNGNKQAFLKFRIRKTIDFPIVSVASVLTLDSGKVREARIALSGVAPIPWRSKVAEAFIMGNTINEENAEEAGKAAIADANPVPQNKYIVQIVKALVKRAILASR
jgi:NADPH-dependent glutamate synthase beta subunit-like oxidoreductase/CO/xanthine dehydrogenase FAD-binding subunit